MRTEWGVHALAGTGVADVGQGRQTGAGRRVEGGQGMDAGGAQVVDGSGFHVGDPSPSSASRGCPMRGTVRGGHELDVPGEAPSLAGVPQVVALLRGAGHPVAGDEGAVQYHMAQPLLATALQHLMQLRGALDEDVDALVEVPVAGGLGDARVPGQAGPRSRPRGTSAVRSASGDPRRTRRRRRPAVRAGRCRTPDRGQTIPSPRTPLGPGATDGRGDRPPTGSRALRHRAVRRPRPPRRTGGVVGGG